MIPGHHRRFFKGDSSTAFPSHAMTDSSGSFYCITERALEAFRENRIFSLGSIPYTVPAGKGLKIKSSVSWTKIFSLWEEKLPITVNYWALIHSNPRILLLLSQEEWPNAKSKWNYAILCVSFRQKCLSKRDMCAYMGSVYWYKCIKYFTGMNYNKY